MNAYYAYDRIEEQNYERYYQQLAREERESELADGFEQALPLYLFESLCLAELLRCGASKKAISAVFNDDVDFQEHTAEHRRCMAEAIARHQTKIEFKDNQS